MVPALDRYCHSPEDLVNMVGELRRREIGFCSLHERLDTTPPRRPARLPRYCRPQVQGTYQRPRPLDALRRPRVRVWNGGIHAVPETWSGRTGPPDLSATHRSRGAVRVGWVTGPAGK
ncbi:hypothetical protein ACFC58_39700 [Kitasatospora purpeofusca]|uniref:hypothetical protein n=1 Tax=Kitasatospora purpeofusca TaxID=67352 RepID=UPI0035E2F20B